MQHSSKTMYPLIERYLEGDQTQKAFSASHNISLAVLNYWISKYRRDHISPKAFIEVKPPVIPQAFAEISFASGARVQLLAPVSASYLLELVR
ncbi:MAG: hypothetical protein AB8G77_26815 [Rhodothermales bacterium]